MNSIQVNPCKPRFYAKNGSQPHISPSKSCVLAVDASPLSGTSLNLRLNPSFGLLCMPVLKSQRPLHVCSAGGKGMMENNEDSPWKSLEKAMQNFKGQSIEDVLRQQIQKGEYYENGGNGGKPPGRGGGGGGSGPGGSEDGRFPGMSDETIQVVLATIGFLLLYVCVNDGVELAKLTRDIIKFLFGGGQSPRLRRAIYKWTRLFQNMTEKKEVVKDASEKAPTGWFESPTSWFKPDHGDVIRSFMRSDSNSNVSA
ncbi:hypothetical protein RIF29_19433 [Crotalaria pallida]|uniref:Uncharacterized protein n=1 Tax=Crotalaria pallida TaxID=3830 RepID=A0AAN9F7T3_CROPI